ncbi:MAG: septal ring lytic transglycosylase RlpA family protein [Microscillaceae bacterium]|nr:septal ring lytic transglycosylase RlpA family protein [Microscillaceae bacterium]
MNYKALFSLLLFLFLYTDIQAQYGPGFKETGVISYFTDKVADRTTANGEKFDNEALVACHNQIPFNSKVKVTNLANGKSVIVRINDRGPYAYGRIMDISKAAAKKIDLILTGIAKAQIEVIPEKEKQPILAEEEPDTKTPVKSESNYQVGKTYSRWGTVREPKGYGVQAGGFTNINAALEFCKLLKDKGLEENKLFIQVVLREGAKFFKIIVGEFATALETSDLKEDIRKKTGQTCFTTTHLK